MENNNFQVLNGVDDYMGSVNKRSAFKKLVQARMNFQNSGAKMSGENKFAKYRYYELSDILPVINRMSSEMGFICIVSFDADKASLEFIDIDTSDSIIFYSPMAIAELKGTNAVQNLGATQTYIKRYLYQNCFEIVESDEFNATQGKQEQPKPAVVTGTRQEQEKMLRDYLNKKEFDAKAFWTRYASIDLMTNEQMSEALVILSNKPNKGEGK